LPTVTVSDKGRVVIAAAFRRLGLVLGSKLNLVLEGGSIRIRPLTSIPASRAEDGYGMLRCDLPGKRRLGDFDVAEAITGRGR
jgi:bifunctional DNA-binding transcriptional regulator/antitoxin component of YhaV-PrlF toxin-antitoxin module